MTIDSATYDNLPTPEPQHEGAPPDGFGVLGLDPDTLHAIAELGFETPTPIQEQTITLLLSGRDVMAQAPTGTGKTAAFGLPIVERLDEDDLRPQALVVVPTRELAIQVSEALHALGKYRDMVTLPIYGGQPYDRQFHALARGIQVVVGTPGRLLDHLRRGTLDLGSVRTVVLDEADEMLNMGFIEDIEALLAELPSEHQTALFSATIPPRIARLAERYLREPVRVSVATREAVAPSVRQVYYDVPGPAKPEALARILDMEDPESAIVFVRTRRDADTVAEKLNGLGYPAQAIHGDRSQAQRERVLSRFRTGHTQLLVATDVAARGLDIPDVSHVINYDLPGDPELYVHRVGRTGRAGRSGEALTLVTPRERRYLRVIEGAIHRRLQHVQLPTAADVAARRRTAFREEVLAILDTGELDPFLALVEELADTRDPAELAAAAFKMALQAREGGRTAGEGSWGQPVRSTDATRASSTRTGTPTEEPRDRDRRGPASRVEQPSRPEAARPEMVRLFIRVGRRDGARPADFVGAITDEAGLPGHAVGDIAIYDTFSFVDVPAELADQVISALGRTTIRGRQTQAVLARPGSESQGRDGGRDRGRGPSGGGFASRPTGRRDRDGGDDRRGGRVRYGSHHVRSTGRRFGDRRRGPDDGR